MMEQQHKSGSVDEKKVEEHKFDTDSQVIAIKSLEGNGITRLDIEKLKSAGFTTVKAVAFAPTKRLQCIRGITDEKAARIMKEARRHFPMGFTKATEVFIKRSDIVRITTGSSKLDAILGGGIQPGITEIFGPSSSGKTQLCHTLAVTTQLPIGQGGAGAKCIFLDCENTFRSDRLIPCAERFSLDGSQVLDNVIFQRIYNSDQLLDSFTKVAAFMTESKVGLIIVDSIISCVRFEYNGRGELADRQAKLGQMLRKLSDIVNEFNVSVVVCNQVVAEVDGNLAFVKDPYKPAGGHILAHGCKTRLSLRKGTREMRVGKVVASAELPEAEAEFAIKLDGINDADPE